MAIIAAPDGKKALAGIHIQRFTTGIGQLQRRCGIALGPLDGLPSAFCQVDAGASGQVILAGHAVILYAGGSIQHKHIGERCLLVIARIHHGAAIGIVFQVQAHFRRINQFFGILVGKGDIQAFGILLLRVLALDKVEQRHVGTGGISVIGCQAGVDQIFCGVPAVFLPVAAVGAVLVKGKTCGARMVAVQILVLQHVQQVGSIHAFVNVYRNGIQRQHQLQRQIPPWGHRAGFFHAVHTGKHRGQPGSLALGHALNQHIRSGNAPLGGAAIPGADADRHRALVGIIALLPGQGVHFGFRRWGGCFCRLCCGLRCGRCGAFRRGAACQQHSQRQGCGTQGVFFLV